MYLAGKQGMSKVELRVVYFYEFKLGRTAAETARNVNKVWGEGTVNESTVQRWFQKFRNGNFDLTDAKGRGRHEDFNNNHLKDIIEADPRKSTREVATEIGVNHKTVLRHLKQIGKVKKLDKFVPHLLNKNQESRRYEICCSLLKRNENDPFLDRIVTCDEKWVLYDNRKRSAQWLDKDEKPKQFPKPNFHQKKIMLSVWWYSKGIIHYNFLKTGETITAVRYCKDIEEMHKKLTILCPALVFRKGPIILHDNARPHVAQITQQKLSELGYEILSHPPYSPDLSPTDYHLFKHLDQFMQNKQFKDRDAVENAFRAFIETRTQDFYATGLNKLVSRWQQCVQLNGCYFDK